jgi:hypothetical protein
MVPGDPNVTTEPNLLRYAPSRHLEMDGALESEWPLADESVHMALRLGS